MTPQLNTWHCPEVQYDERGSCAGWRVVDGTGTYHSEEVGLDEALALSVRLNREAGYAVNARNEDLTEVDAP